LLPLSPGIDTLAERVLARVPQDASGRVAVTPFLELDGSVSHFGIFVSERLTTRLIERGTSVVERSRLDAAIQELDLTRSVAFDREEVQRLGRQVGAGFIVTGSISELATFVEVNARLFDTATGEVAGAGQVSLVKDQDLLALLHKRIDAAAPTRHTVADRPGPAPPEKKLPSEVHNGVRVELAGCHLESSQLQCRGYVTTPDDRVIYIQPQTSFVDPQGKELLLARSTLGAEANKTGSFGAYAGTSARLIPQTRTRLILVFDGVPDGLSEIAALRIVTDSRGSRGDFVFRSVPVSR
jgi:TolB-like protein